MKRIFFAPVADISQNSKFSQTAINGISIKGKHQKVWGVISPEVTWNRLKSGDLLYIYNKGFIVYRATIESKFQDTSLSEKLWNPKHKIDGTILFYDKIMILKDVCSCNIDFSVFKQLAGYKDKASVRKFIELPDLGYTNLKEQFGTIEKLEKNYPQQGI